MSPRFPRTPPKALVPGGALAFLLVLSASLAAQEPELQRDYPTLGPFECPVLPTPVAPSADQATRAQQLTTDALQAVILGDLEGARTLLSQAAESDPTSAEVAYRHGRVLEDLEFLEVAILEYCRSIDLGAVDQGIVDGRQRLDALYEIVRERISPVAREAFIQGLRDADAQLYASSEASFTTAVDEAPTWPSAVFNRAVVRERLGLIRESLEDYRRYLELTPTEIDPIVAMVSERIGALEGSIVVPTPSPTGALTLGAVFPGMGQYYSGRPLGGTVVLTTAAAAIATGFMVKKVTVTCLDPSPANGVCPANEIVDESSERPYMLPAMAAAGVITLGAAIEAFIRARGRRADQEAAVGELFGMELAPPSLSTNGGQIDVNVVSLRFR